MKKHFLCLLLLGGALGAQATASTSPAVAEVTQQGVLVKGVVKDAKGEPIIKGDAKALCIAAASILAKVTRDRYMKDLEKEHPQFKFSVHKGYGTALHLKEIEENGPIEGVHRKTFSPVAKYYSKQLTLF